MGRGQILAREPTPGLQRAVAKQLPQSRGVEGHFLALRDHSAKWVEDLLELANLAPSDDPVRHAEENLEVVREFFGKWSMEILVTLYSRHAVGFEELRRQLKGVTPRVLSGRLKGLEARRLIVRRVLNDRPPRVQYRLSPEGLILARLGEPAFLFLRLRTKGPR